jgi:integrase
MTCNEMVDPNRLELLTSSMSRVCITHQDCVAQAVPPLKKSFEFAGEKVCVGVSDSLTHAKTVQTLQLEIPAMITELPPLLAAKLDASLPRPEFKEWAVKHGTPWVVNFPARTGVPGKRRFFADPAVAVDEILKWSKDRKPDAVLGKRIVDDVLWAQSMLPPGITLRDAVRYFIEHNAAMTAASKMTLKEICEIVLADLTRVKSSKSYLQTIRLSSATMRKELGDDTQVSLLTKATLIRFIRNGEEYWDRFGRKRIASIVCSKALELEIFKHSPLEGFSLEKAPQKDIHALTNSDTQVIVDYFYENYPDYLPAVALQLFAGIRTEELAREDTATKQALRWEDVRFGEFIDVKVKTSKTGHARRIAFWPEALTNLLAPFRKASGRILDIPKSVEAAKFNFGSDKGHIIEDMNAERVKNDLAPVDFQKNDFRHTFASNCALVQSVHVTQDCLGHTNHRTITRYRNTERTKEEAEAYFKMRPTSVPSNVIAMTA